jgi:hypothetical protein
MTLLYPLPNRNSVNLAVPSFTLDVNQIPLKPPPPDDADRQGLVGLEWNYFRTRLVELCVTPAATLEISAGYSLANMGSQAVRRLHKSQLFKNRPPGVVLDLSPADSDDLWSEMRHDLFPTVADRQLTEGQVADVHEIFLHTVSAGSSASNSVFLTKDEDFLAHSALFNDKYGVTIMPPATAWSTFRADYGLQAPTESDAYSLWAEQMELIARISLASE